MDVDNFLAAQRLTHLLCLGNHLQPILKISLAVASAIEPKAKICFPWSLDDKSTGFLDLSSANNMFLSRSLNLGLLT